MASLLQTMLNALVKGKLHLGRLNGLERFPFNGGFSLPGWT